MLKKCLIFVAGIMVGSYTTYNKMYRTVADIVIKGKTNKETNKETEKSDN